MRSVFLLITWMVLIFLGFKSKSLWEPTRRSPASKKTYTIGRSNNSIKHLDLNKEGVYEEGSEYEDFDDNKKTNSNKTSSVNNSLKNINFKIKDAFGHTDYPIHGKLSRETREDEKEWFK